MLRNSSAFPQSFGYLPLRVTTPHTVGGMREGVEGVSGKFDKVPSTRLAVIDWGG